MTKNTLLHTSSFHLIDFCFVVDIREIFSWCPGILLVPSIEIPLLWLLNRGCPKTLFLWGPSYNQQPEGQCQLCLGLQNCAVMWCVLTGEFWLGQSNRSWNNRAIKVGCWPCDFSMKSRQFLLPLCYFCKLTGTGKVKRVKIRSVKDSSEIEGTTNAFFSLRAWGNGPKIYNSPSFWYS